jgi:protein archease
VGRAADGGIDLALRAADASTVEIIGAAPKAASLSGLACAPDASGHWSCAVTIDV